MIVENSLFEQKFEQCNNSSEVYNKCTVLFNPIKEVSKVCNYGFGLENMLQVKLKNGTVIRIDLINNKYCIAKEGH